MTSKSPEFSEFRRSSRLQPLRRRSRSAAVIDVQLDADRVGGGGTDGVDDADFDWDRRRQSANSDEPSSRLSTWLQRRLMTFSRAAAAPGGDDRAPTAVAAPAQQPTGGEVEDGPPTEVRGCCGAATTTTDFTPGVLDVTHDCKCVSCPELADGAPVDDRQRRHDRPPTRHHAVRKTCSDTGFIPAPPPPPTSSDGAAATPLLSVPAVFVTSYTRSIQSQHPEDHHHHHHHQQQQQDQRRRSASLAAQRLISMSDSRLGDGDHRVAAGSPTTTTTPPSSARIWKLTEFLCRSPHAVQISSLYTTRLASRERS